MDNIIDSCFGWFVFILVTILLLACAYGIVLMVVEGVSSKECLQAGYPNTRVTFDFKAYCVEVDGSVQVSAIPLDEINKEK